MQELRGQRRFWDGAKRFVQACSLAPNIALRMIACTPQFAAGGKSRMAANAYKPADDPTTPADQAIWNPDGTRGGMPDWFAFLVALTGPAATNFNNAIR